MNTIETYVDDWAILYDGLASRLPFLATKRDGILREIVATFNTLTEARLFVLEKLREP